MDSNSTIQKAGSPWENLRISNDFLFGKVMQDPTLCTELLRRILPGLDIDHVEYPELQKASCQRLMRKASGWMMSVKS